MTKQRRVSMPLPDPPELLIDCQSSHQTSVVLEIHMPGLDLDTKRWNYHTIFMTELHANLAAVGTRAYVGYKQGGRGAFFADVEQWLQVVKRRFDAVESPFPVSYLPQQAIQDRVDFGPLQQGFLHLLETYDPECQFLVVVTHHPGDVLSCYLIAPETGPVGLYLAQAAGHEAQQAGNVAGS